MPKCFLPNHIINEYKQVIHTLERIKNDTSPQVSSKDGADSYFEFFKMIDVKVLEYIVDLLTARRESSRKAGIFA